MSDSVEAGALKLGDTVVGSPASAETGAPVDTPGSALDIEAFRRGDPECFRVLVKRFGPLIKDIAASYTKDRDQQDDLYQEASVRLLTQRARYATTGEHCGAGSPAWRIVAAAIGVRPVRRAKRLSPAMGLN